MSNTNVEMDIYSRNQIGRAKVLPDGRWELLLTAGGDPLYYTDEEFRSIYARSNPQLPANTNPPGPVVPPLPSGPRPVS